MERLGDDELLVVFNKLPIRDRKSFSRISKQFLRVACIKLLRLSDFSIPHLLCHILPLSSKLSRFECSKPISNTHMKLLGQSCPKLRSLRLILEQDIDTDYDFDDDGLCTLANGCRKLYEVILTNRLHVGDAGVISLVKSCKHLRVLNLDRCIGVSDESLKVIGNSRIRKLSFRGCNLITDLGLKYLAKGNTKTCLKNLILAECDRITDKGIIYLKHITCLIELNLSKCGIGVTDYGVLALSSQISNIWTLDLSWLMNVTDISMNAISSNCPVLEYLILTGCEAITGEGLHAFTNHGYLFDMVLFSCRNISWKDVRSFGLSTTKFTNIWLSRRLSRRLNTPNQEGKIIYNWVGKCFIQWKCQTRL